MPIISKFLGIIITMYYYDHSPPHLLTSSPPHFHAKYGEFEIIVYLSSGKVEGKFPKRALSAVMEWYNMHKEELEESWRRSQIGEELIQIEPLE